MQRSTRATQVQGTRATVRLRADRFEAVAEALGASTAQARADLIGVDRTHLYRVATGRVRVGEHFIAQTISALRNQARRLRKTKLAPRIDDLFEVVDLAIDEDVAA